MKSFQYKIIQPLGYQGRHMFASVEVNNEVDHEIEHFVFFKVRAFCSHQIKYAL